MAFENLRHYTKRVMIGIIGGLVVAVGLIMIPYPGPGWLVVFGGLAILATEFKFAAKVLEYAKGKYDAWSNWLKKQNVGVQIIVLALTGLVVVVTIWLVNGFGILNTMLFLNLEWLISPLLH